MLDFLRDVTDITLGLMAIVFWLIVLLAGLIEFFDFVTGADKKQQELEALLKESRETDV